ELDHAEIAAEYQARAEALERGQLAHAEPAHAEPSQVEPQSIEEARALADEYEQQALAERDPERKASLLSLLASLRSEKLDELEGAIAALRQALGATPGDVAIMHQLATCLIARAEAAGPEEARTDQRRAAELFYQIAQGVDESEALPYLESA